MKVGATKIQTDSSDKKEMRKRCLILKYNDSSGKVKEKKCKLILLKSSLMVMTRKNQEKVVVTKICFYGKTKWNMKVGATKIQPNGSVKKEIRKRG